MKLPRSAVALAPACGPILTWTGLGSASTVNVSGRGHSSIAVLTDASEASLALSRRPAHAQVFETKIEWPNDGEALDVTSTFRYAP